MSEEENEEDSNAGEEEGANEEFVENRRGFADPSLSLSPQIIANLARRGLTTPAEVQLRVIPKIRNERGRDILVNAPTGSGKTLAYALPISEV
jgi:superfamily II DNA/RNA helicase